MAVQAQYPSNILLLNRNGQDGGRDFSLQPQAGGGGGGFLDQSSSHRLFTTINGGNNNNTSTARKRGREEIEVNGVVSTAHQYCSLQMQQPQSQPQLIDLSQLHNNRQHNQPNAVVSTGLRLSSGHDQHHHYHQNQHQQSSNNAVISLLSQDFNTQFKRQRDEIDHFIQAQGEQLRRTLAEKRQMHYRALLSAAEESMSRRLREKDAEVEKATRRNAELEARAAQLSVEAQVWQAKVRAQEATAASLQAQLHQARMGGVAAAAAADNRREDDGMGCSGAGGGVEGQAEDAESAYVDPERVTVLNGPSCKSCRRRAATVVALPCRHLCLCTTCDQVAQACPLCLQVRNSSVEVFLC